MTECVRNELWAWVGICKKKHHLLLIPITILSVVWKERNGRVFEGIKNNFTIIRNK